MHDLAYTLVVSVRGSQALSPASPGMSPIPPRCFVYPRLAVVPSPPGHFRRAPGTAGPE